jgi:hypothetical protein
MARNPGSRARDYDKEPSTNLYGPKPVNPHSPWQLLVEKQREQIQISIRAVATRAQIPAGTLFNWIRARSGAPPRVTYTQDVNKRLAKVLKLKEEELADAYNQSAFRPVDPKVIEKPPAPPRPTTVQENSTVFTVDGLRRFLQMLKASGRTSFTVAELESMAALLITPDPPPDGQAT